MFLYPFFRTDKTIFFFAGPGRVLKGIEDEAVLPFFQSLTRRAKERGI
jgi:hypothetical protein